MEAKSTRNNKKLLERLQKIKQCNASGIVKSVGGVANSGRITPTEEQDSIVKLARKGHTMKIEAFAGAAKTSTLKMIANDQGVTKKGLYLSFNRANVEAANFPSQVEARTFHSLAFKSVGYKYKKRLQRVPPMLVIDTLNIDEELYYLEEKYISVDRNSSFDRKKARKVFSKSEIGSMLLAVITKFCEDDERVIKHEHFLKAVKEILIVPKGCGSAEALSQYLWTRFGEYSKVLWEIMSGEEFDDFPTTHGVYAKVWALTNPQLTAYDYIMFDEAQDADPLMIGVLTKQRAPVIWVGDSYQQIYQWRGAVNALGKIKTKDVAFLSKSFRYGNEIAEAASNVLRSIGCNRQILGNEKIVSKIVHDDYNEISLPTKHTKLFRTNGAIVEWLLCNSKKLPKTFVTSKEKVKELIVSLDSIRRGKVSEKAGALRLFKSWGEIVEYTKSREGRDLRLLVSLMNGERPLHKDNDKVEVDDIPPWEEQICVGEMEAINYNKLSDSDKKQLDKETEDLLDLIDSTAALAEEADIIISTMHSAKGLEWDTVQIAADIEEYLWDLEEENITISDLRYGDVVHIEESEARLLYVALTRAKEYLDLSLLSPVAIDFITGDNKTGVKVWFR